MRYLQTMVTGKYSYDDKATIVIERPAVDRVSISFTLKSKAMKFDMRDEEARHLQSMLETVLG